MKLAAVILALLLVVGLATAGSRDDTPCYDEIDVGFTYWSREWKLQYEVLQRGDNGFVVKYTTWKTNGMPVVIMFYQTERQIYADSDLLKP